MSEIWLKYRRFVLYMFSKACEYSIRAVIYIASRSSEGERTNLRSISESIDSPEAFTAKLLQNLVREGLIDSVKGVQGGFEISESRLQKLRLCDVVKAVDGDSVYKMCGIGLKDCSEKNPCPVHSRFKSIRKDLKEMVETTYVKDLLKGIRSGKTTLRI